MFFNGRHGLSFVAHHCGECKNSTVVCKSVYCSPHQYDCFFLYTAPFPLKGISCWFSSNNIAPSNVSLTLDDSPIILMALCCVLSVISSTHSSNVFPFLFQQLSEEVIDIIVLSILVGGGLPMPILPFRSCLGTNITVYLPGYLAISSSN